MRVIGQSIFTTYLLAFEVTSALLVVAVVGAVVLARRPRLAPAGDGRRVPARGRDRWRRTEPRTPGADRAGDEAGTARRDAAGEGRRVGGHRAMSVSASWYLTLAAVLFTIGAVGLLVRRNVLVMFMCVELMLNAANLTFVTFARQAERHRRPDGGLLRARRGRRRGGRRARASSSRSTVDVPGRQRTTSTG